MIKNIEARTFKGKFSLHRVNSNADKYLPVRIELEDDASSCRVIQVEISLEDFAEAMLGHGFRDCRFTYYDPPLGKTREYKTVVLSVPSAVQWKGRGEKRSDGKEYMRPYEVDGWVGSTYDFQNGHNWGRSEDGVSPVRVNFTRFV